MEKRSTGKPSKKQSSELIDLLKREIREATLEEKNELAEALGVGQSIRTPADRQAPLTNNEQVREESRVNRGSGVQIVGPPDWVVEVGGGIRVDSDKNPLPGEQGWSGNWAVQVYRERWAAGKPPLPNVDAYLRERANSGSYDGSLSGQAMQNADNLATVASTS